MAEAYLLFVPKLTGYELHERRGEVPAPGAKVEENGSRLAVSKVAPSPLPGDPRRCVYLQPVE